MYSLLKMIILFSIIYSVYHYYINRYKLREVKISEYNKLKKYIFDFHLKNTDPKYNFQRNEYLEFIRDGSIDDEYKIDEFKHIYDIHKDIVPELISIERIKKLKIIENET